MWKSLLLPGKDNQQQETYFNMMPTIINCWHFLWLYPPYYYKFAIKKNSIAFQLLLTHTYNAEKQPFILRR